MVSKYCDHLPLYRQSRIYARDGVDIDRATMAGWVEQVHVLLDPLVAVLGRHVLQGPKVHADDTPVKVLTPGNGKARTGRLWVYVRDDRPGAGTEPPAAWYRYSSDRKGEHPRAHLRGFGGILRADAYAGLGGLYEAGVTETACWAHARRPWWDLYEQQRDESGLAAQALARIQALYAIESEILGQPPQVRREQRRVRAGPLLLALHAWLHGVLAQVSAKSELARAARYSLERWPALTRYVEDGRIEIDISSEERALRGIDTVSAVGLVCEIGNITRFATAGQLMGYLGLVPSERSSCGNSVRRGSITKTGSAHAGRLLTEAAWNYRLPARISNELRDRSKALPPGIRTHAWKAQVRLCSRFA